MKRKPIRDDEDESEAPDTPGEENATEPDDPAEVTTAEDRPHVPFWKR